MSSELITVKLGSLISINSKSITSKLNFKSIEYIDTSSVTENKFETPQFLKIDDAPSRAKRLVSKGDTIISTVRPIQKHYGFIQKCKQNTVVSTGFAVVTPIKISPVYLYYYLTQEHITSYLNSIAESSATTYPAFKPEILNELDITLPNDIEIQESIGKILLNLDNKFFFNTRVNNSLETIAQTLFKSWFVDFDPVKAKIRAIQQGEEPQLAAMKVISGKSAEDIIQMPADKRKELSDTADLFPEEMVDSEFGMIPNGWKVGKIGDIYNSKGGYAFKSDEFTNEGFPVVKIKNITNSGYVDLNDTQKVKLETVKSKESFILQDGDIIMAMTGATIGKVGIISNYTNINCYQNQRVAKFCSIKKLNNLNWFVYLFFKKEENLNAIISMAQGSAQPNISTTGIDGVSAIIPSIKLLNRFNLVVDPLFKTWISNTIQGNNLSETRNLLLPELISGKLSLNE